MTTITGAASYRAVKPQKSIRRKQLPVQVAETTSQAAPVAVLIPGCREFPARAGGSMAEVRYWQGTLYRQVLDAGKAPVTPAHKSPASCLTTSFGTHDDAETAVQAIVDGVGGYLLIDGEFWQRTAEPRYLLNEFGHWVRIVDREAESDGAHRVFSLTEPEAATAKAAGFARFGRPAPIVPAAEIIIAEAFTLPGSAVRVAEARQRSEEEKDQAVQLLQDSTPGAMRRASFLLSKAADDLERQTGDWM